jgi:hypothetical protein
MYFNNKKAQTNDTENNSNNNNNNYDENFENEDDEATNQKSSEHKSQEDKTKNYNSFFMTQVSENLKRLNTYTKIHYIQNF